MRETIRMWRALGHRGWPSVYRELKGCVPIRVVQEIVPRLIKKRDRRLARLHHGRVAVEVLCRNAFWTQDTAYTGQIGEQSVESLLTKDRGTTETLAIETGVHLTAADVIAGLEHLRRTRGLPLVLAHDRGSIFANVAVDAYLMRHEVVHLLNAPRTPEHNGAAEISVRDYRRVTGLGPRVLVSTVSKVQELLEAARDLIDGRWRRASRGLKTARELAEGEMPDHAVDRSRFYQQCRMRISEAVLGIPKARARMLAEREAIFSTMEQYGLIRRTRDGQPVQQ